MQDIVQLRRGAIYCALLLLIILLLATSVVSAKGGPPPAPTYLLATPTSQKSKIPNQAALVILHGDGRVTTRVVSFSEESISGLELLQRANVGAEIDVFGLGGAVAAVEGEGCHPPKEDAFCQCKGGECKFWRYFHLDPGPPAKWKLANSGAGDYRVRPDAVEGWAWGSKAVPPLYTFAQLVTPTARPQPTTRTPSRKLTATGTPSRKLTPSPTPRRTVTPRPLASGDSQPPTTGSTTSLPTPPSPIPMLLIAGLLAALPFVRPTTRARLNSRAWLAWLLAAVLVGSGNPYYLLILLLIGLIVYRALPPNEAAEGEGLLLRLGLITFALITAINFLTAHYGATVLAELPREWPVLGGVLTAEGLVWGAVRGLTILCLIVAFAAFNRGVRHREVLGLIPSPFRRLGMVASVGVLFVPQTLAAARSVQQAQALRGYRMRPRDLLPLFAPLLLLSLEKASQLAEALATRAWGYAPAGFRGRTVYRHIVWRTQDRAVLAVSLAVATTVLLLRVFPGGVFDYNPYPAVGWPAFDWLPAILLLLLAVPAVVGLPARQTSAAITLQRSNHEAS